MRVAFVSMRTTHHEDHGSTRRLRRLAESLATRGHDVTVCCAQWWGADVPTFEQNDVTYRRACESPSPGAFLQGLPSALRMADPEVVHARHEPPLGAVTARLAAALLRVPTLVDWYAAPRERPDAWLARGHGLAARAGEVTVAPSEMVATGAREYGAAAADLEVVPGSVDMDTIREADADERADVVYARDLDADANVESFLLALAELRDRDWRACVVGDGPARAAAEETAADLRIDDRVEFLGDLPLAERVPVLKGAHVFAQTAAYEPFAEDLLLALACGCVGIVEYQAGSSAHELVEGRERHALVTSPQELAAEIAAAADAERRAVDEDFAVYDREAVLERYLSTYRDLMDDYGLI
jgi:glycosyltransferase involved in cell wall biosynthesis